MKKLMALVISLALIFSLSLTSYAAAEQKPFDNSCFFKCGDYTLHYRVYDSSEDKNRILLIHGFCLSTASLDGIASEYQKAGYDVVTVDVPNFGYSSRETTDTNFLSREEVIHALMAHLGGTWIVGGHSMGGGIAINLACDYSELVTGLVLFAPQTSTEMTGIMAKISASCLMQKIYDVILKTALKVPVAVKLLVAMSFSSTEYAESYDLSIISDPLSLSGTGAGITIMSSHAKGSDLNKLSELKIPCTVITAKNDMVAMKSNLQAILDNAPTDFYTYEFAEGGHMMMEYAPENVAMKTLPTIEKCK